MKVNFKTGVYIGLVFGLLLGLYGYFYAQKMIEKTEDVANINLDQFDYQLLDGTSVKLSDYQGKNVLINFWATWCGPCIGEFPLLQAAQERLQDEFIILTVSYEDIDKINRFVEDNDYDFVFLKSNNFILEGISSVPQSFILDKKGIKVYHHPTIFEGEVDELVNMLMKYVE